MKRILMWVVLPLLCLALTLGTLIGVRVGAADPLPPPDPSLAIDLPGGEQMALADVVDRAQRGLSLPLELPPAEPLFPDAPPDMPPFMFAGNVIEFRRGPFPLVNGQPLIPDDPVYALAEMAQYEGRNEQAMALYLSLPSDNKYYAKARRTVAWEILARDLDRPAQGVKFANEALHADFFDGNAWHDWARVHARTLGLPLD